MSDLADGVNNFMVAENSFDGVLSIANVEAQSVAVNSEG